jgi:3-oxoisoapionate kinase
MPAISFVADDLTGAADVLAQAHRYGLDAVLVVGGGDTPLPTDADVVGVAGPARSLGGEEFDELVRAQLAQIARIGVEVLLYKVCSTFDSLPTLGSIGRGIELLHEQFAGLGPVAVAPAQPQFGRYTAFSNHFGVFSGQVHRLDRHPVMSRHPSTPMREADLRQVLAEQFTDRHVPAALHLPAYADGSFTERWRACQAESGPAFVVDAVTDDHLDEVAHALRGAGQTSETHPHVVVGSGGIMAALARTATGREARQPGRQQSSGPVLAVSASASSTTAAQIGDAMAHGWADVPVPVELLNSDDPGLTAAVEEHTAAALSAGRDVVVHTTRGSEDPRYAASGPADPRHIGGLLGTLVGRMATAGLTRDVAVLGGDTSSHALMAMGVRELRVSDQFVTAGPVCRTDDHAAVAGCRLLLKGGQVGPPDILRLFAGRSKPLTNPAEHTTSNDERGRP